MMCIKNRRTLTFLFCPKPAFSGVVRESNGVLKTACFERFGGYLFLFTFEEVNFSNIGLERAEQQLPEKSYLKYQIFEFEEVWAGNC